MKHMLRRDSGFALPTILIASVIMLMILMASVTAVSSITSGLNSQYYNQLAREAAESGLARAESCLRLSDYVPTWTDAQPLTPKTDCAGSNLGGVSQWVYETSNSRSYFTVLQPTVGAASSVKILATGKVELLRTSDPGSVYRSYTVTIGKNSRYNDTPQIAGGAGWKDTDHNGYMLAGSGILYGWGSNQSYQLGDPSLGLPAFVTTPVKMAYPSGVTRAKRVFNSGQGASIVCILANHNTLGDQIYCRGLGGIGGATWQRFGLPGGLTAVDMSVNGYGGDSGCVIASDLQAYCAGINDSGGLGRAIPNNADFVPVTSPTKFRLDLASPGPLSGPASALTVKKVFNQDRFTCVIASDNQAYCAGDNNYGQLGHGNQNTNTWVGNATPGRAVIPGAPAVADIRLTYHSATEGVFYQTEAGDIFMSGHNQEGTSSDDSDGTASFPPPLQVYSTPRQLTSGAFSKIISVGEEGAPRHAICAVATAPPGNSGFWCIGRSNNYGEFGIGVCSPRDFWQGALNLSGNVASTSVNPEAYYQMNSVMVMTNSGDVYAAGDNTYGKLGTGGALNACSPNYAKVQLPAGVKGVAVANGDEYTAFVLGDNGKLYSMGRNHNGQLGNGTMTNSNVPVEVKIPRQETLF